MCAATPTISVRMGGEQHTSFFYLNQSCIADGFFLFFFLFFWLHGKQPSSYSMMASGQITSNSIVYCIQHNVAYFCCAPAQPELYSVDCNPTWMEFFSSSSSSSFLFTYFFKCILSIFENFVRKFQCFT